MRCARAGAPGRWRRCSAATAIFPAASVNGSLSFERAKIFADLARRYGNGAFDLSARANLQMRGVSVEDILSLAGGTGCARPARFRSARRSRRNIVPSPLAGFDPTALIDARPLVEVLDALLTREKALHDLPPKFGFSVDGRGVLPLRGVETDIGFAAFLDDEGRVCGSRSAASSWAASRPGISSRRRKTSPAIFCACALTSGAWRRLSRD